MEFRHLKTLKTVVEAGGITRAAEQLGYAQSSVTMQIHALEGELGIPLFDRLGKKLVLTAAGEKLLHYAVRLLNIHDEALAEIRAQTEPAGTLTIGTPESLAAFRLPALLQEYKQRFPKVKLIINPGLCTEMRNLLRRGELDLAFLLEAEHEEEEDLAVETLVFEEMALVAAPDHPLARAEEVKPKDIQNEIILQTEKGCSYRTLFEQYLMRNGINTTQGEEFWSIEAIKNCVQVGLGLAFLPMITVRKELQEGRLSRLNWRDETCGVFTKMAYHKKKWLSPAVKEWIELVRNRAEHWRSN
ncbi:LysR family transcriptional regulator [Thermoactinomyces sp. CICC 10522]|uniref:LysR family transcriptional regulator n=1 Tax=Thermoactinomyces sp. CICC 10522 TaxID=2767427 RepID=UPI0018DEC15F|nr:LysR family transcriptional regulator [Thermoactinomyces sp. CICC 10522]MBH8603568.1 LysR family transcriptional regulator [Thermoactinomyces sp. CICC 10522]